MPRHPALTSVAQLPHDPAVLCSWRIALPAGSNVDGYSPIYTPDIWSQSGESYSLGTKGLIAWAGLVVVLLGVGINLVVATSNL